MHVIAHDSQTSAIGIFETWEARLWLMLEFRQSPLVRACPMSEGATDMSNLKSVWLILAFALPLFGQVHPPRQPHLGAYEWAEDTVPSVMNYCDGADNFSRQVEPRLFARLKPDSRTELDAARWREFASKDKWEAAGKPTPLVFVWDRNGGTIKVTVVAKPPQVWNPVGAYRRTEYCYGTDARLIRIRAVEYVPTRCEFLFPCKLISRHEFFLSQSPGMTDWIFSSDGTITKLWNGKSRDDYFDPSHSLTVSDLHLKTSDELPFHQLTQPK